MHLARKSIITFDEIVIENSYGKRIRLDKLRVPMGHNVADFSLEVCVRDIHTAETTFAAALEKTKLIVVGHLLAR